MKKYIYSILLALIVGYFCGKYMLNQYDDKEELIPVFSQKETLYFIQQGVYTTKDTMLENTTQFPNFIYAFIDNYYYAFIGITKDKENIQKLKDYYKEKGYITYVKELSVSNKIFEQELTEYDVLLKNTNESSTIKRIIEDVLKKYKELVVDG